MFSAIDINSVTLSNLSIVILGAEGSNDFAEIEMRAIALENDERVLISYIDDNKLYYTFSTQTETSLKNSDFTYLSPAISHAFVNEQFKTESTLSPQIILYKVDTNNKLYQVYPFTNQKEQLIDTNVSIVHACPCPLISEGKNIVVYIKDGDCYYQIARDGGTTIPKKINLPTGKYIDIRAVSNIDNDYIYVIASHENGSNYIIRSLIEKSTGNLIENLDLSYQIYVSKYIDLSIPTRNCVENLSLNIQPLIAGYIDFNSIFNRVSHSTMNLTYKISTSNYTVDFDGIYGVKLDKNNLVAGTWESYTDDAVGYEPAYMDYENDVFVDNGWTERWPFNKIKPCLMLNGKILGYLNPNNFAQYEDGTAATINNRTKGEVMIEFPKIYYKISTDDNYYYIQISRKAREGFTDRAFWHTGHDNQHIYIGAYLSGNNYVKTQGFYSISGNALNTLFSLSYTKYYQYKEKFNNANLEFMPYSVLTLLQCLYLIMFRNTNSQGALGYGHGSLKTSYKTGQLNKLGMYYGKNVKNTGMKCFGLEDLYGVRMTITSGFYLDENCHPRFIDVYSPNSSFNPSYTTDYLSFNNITLTSGLPSTLTSIIGNNETGFINSVDPNLVDSTLGFTDYCYILKNTNSLVFGMTRLEEDYGIFNSDFVKSSDGDTRWNVRLVYYPNET